MIYYKKTTSNGILYRGLDSATFTVIDIHQGALGNSISKIESESLYTQLNSVIAGEGYVTSTIEEFNSAKTAALAVLNTI